MKTATSRWLIPVLSFFVLLAAYGRNTKRIVPIPDHTVLKYDTLIAVMITEKENLVKTIARDTLVLIIGGTNSLIPHSKAAAGIKYTITPVSILRPDSSGMVKAAARDTLVWTSKPYHKPL